jgi:spore germination cell wall hydrolase CwlJ-like protein
MKLSLNSEPARGVGAWLFIGLAGAVLAVAASVTATESYRAAQLAAGEERLRELQCLALNIYYEARGEPLVGQYAVAEVTLNRVASHRFPDSVCAVVYAKAWDGTAGTWVGAFSWTVAAALESPSGLAWDRAVTIAATAFDNQEAPLVDGALFYHATYVQPEWSLGRERVTRIARHLFYY